MLLTVVTPEQILLETGNYNEGLAVQGDEFGPVQMLAASLALCTASVIQSYGETAQLDLEGLAIEVQWDFAEDPRRVGNYRVVLHLPASVPENRHRAIVRAADTCTVHQTLSHSPTLETTIQPFEPGHAPHIHHHHEHEHHEHEHHDHEA